MKARLVKNMKRRLGKKENAHDASSPFPATTRKEGPGIADSVNRQKRQVV